MSTAIRHSDHSVFPDPPRKPADPARREVEQSRWTAFRHGDEEALGALHESHAERLVAILSRAVGRDDATEIVTKMFESLWARRDGLPDVTSVGAFLTQSARQACRVWRRSAQRRAKHVAAADQAGVFPHVSRRTPESDLNCAEILRGLTKALRRMPVRDRRLFLLVRREGKTAAQAAEVLGITTRRAEKRLAKVKSVLGIELAPWVNGSWGGRNR
jgi:RNA polymerase sigma factor (sigma-70 family)